MGYTRIMITGDSALAFDLMHGGNQPRSVAKEHDHTVWTSKEDIPSKHQCGYLCHELQSVVLIDNDTHYNYLISVHGHAANGAVQSWLEVKKFLDA